MIKVGITGVNGFVGKHLHNHLTLNREKFTIIEFNRSYFNDFNLLLSFIENCDVIVHLAALNRPLGDENINYTNDAITKLLLKGLNAAYNKPHLIFTSSIQEDDSTDYGLSKKKSRLIFNEWAKNNNSTFTGLVLPNLYGPFCKPYYNSFIATFSHQLINGEKPNINIDKAIPLFYISDAINLIIKAIENRLNDPFLTIKNIKKYKVSKILTLLSTYNNVYVKNSEIPQLKNKLEINLFNTFRSYLKLNLFTPKKYFNNVDDRGNFFELIRFKSIGQISYSTTLPGITRGNHFHTRKIERFSIIKGEALIKLRKYGEKEVIEFKFSGNSPSFIDIPIWYVHNITNIGEDELITFFWINEHYNKSDTDTFIEQI
jgi:UDP-2-acetamido-2,6-beta-L-arabino-hexul-4-ose reductase